MKIWLLIGLAIAAFRGSIVSARGAFASREWLVARSKTIGTENPAVARAVCIVGMVVFTAFWVGALVLIIGFAVTGKPAKDWFR